MENSVGPTYLNEFTTYLNEFTLGKFTFTCNVNMCVHYMNFHWDHL